MIVLGLQRISQLLQNTPLPWRAIHVAGTNGKGSVCVQISRMLDVYNDSAYRKEMHQARLSHARFMSPHLMDRWDCITINQKTVPFKLFDHLERQVLKRNDQEGINASEFELLTATAFEIFTHENVDIGVVEVGMGGRLDATNILGQTGDGSHPNELEGKAFRPLPLVAAITAVGLDHQGFLGNTLAEIAREKAGIIKPGVPVVYDASNNVEVRRVINAQAQDNHVVEWKSSSLPVSHIPYDSNSPDELVEAFWSNCSGPHVPEYLRNNSSVAFRATITALQRLKLYPDDFKQAGRFYHREEITTTLEGLDDHLSARELATNMLNMPLSDIPGRLQEIDLRPLAIAREGGVLLDGAHNPQAAELLKKALNRDKQHMNENISEPRHKDHDPIVWVIAFTSTKDAKEILSILLRPGDTVFAVEFGPVDGMPWVEPMKSDDIVKAVTNVGDCNLGKSFGTDLLGALRAAHEASVRHGKFNAQLPIVIAGSLYLVGDMLRLLRAAEQSAED